MTIREFIDRLMLEMNDVRGEKIKYSDYFIVATESLKTVEAVYSPLFDLYTDTPASSTQEITITNPTNKKYFKVGRVSVAGQERYQVDYEYAKLSSNAFIPCYGFKADGSGIKIAFSPQVNSGSEIKAFLFYVHDTAYFSNESNEIELPENYVLIALNIAKQYLFTKYGMQLGIEGLPISGEEAQGQQ